MPDDFVLIRYEDLFEFTKGSFVKLGLNETDAKICADVLLAADLRGVDSHGVARLVYYVMKLKSKTITLTPDIKIVRESATTALVDGGDGMGPVVGDYCMRLAIRKASDHDVGVVTVRRSNHYGIAGYYSMLALEKDMIGISMTNSISLIAPTFGTAPLLGTNPISIAIPAGDEKPFVLDMATSAVALGKLEIAMRQNKPIPPGWALDKDGVESSSPLSVFQGGSLMPLGGLRETGGHKGYGLSLTVDILSAVLSGANYGPKQEGLTSMRPEPSNVGHFFMAINIGAMRPIDEFKASMDEMIRDIKNSEKAEGQDRIYIHGEPEFEAEADRRKNGIPLNKVVLKQIKALAKELGVQNDLPELA